MVDRADLIGQCVRFTGNSAAGAKIRLHAFAQRNGLADVNDVAGRVSHQIHAANEWQCSYFLLDIQLHILRACSTRKARQIAS